MIYCLTEVLAESCLKINEMSGLHPATKSRYKLPQARRLHKPGAIILQFLTIFALPLT